MANVYVVVTSNCEAWEDYSESIDSVWSSRERAIKHIEENLGMTLVMKRDENRPFSRDRWEIEIPEYPRREECDSEEEWLDCFDENGNLMPYYKSYRDAVIQEFTLDGTSDLG